MARQMSIASCRCAYTGRHGVSKFRNIVYKGKSYIVCCSDHADQDRPFGVRIEFIIDRQACQDVLARYHRKGREAVNMGDAAEKALQQLTELGVGE